jgi:hypothetical protein
MMEWSSDAVEILISEYNIYKTGKNHFMNYIKGRVMPEKLIKCLVVRHWKPRRKCSQLLSSSRHKQQAEEERKYGVDAEQTYKWIGA